MKIDIILPINNEEKILDANAKLLFDYCQRHLNNDWQIGLVVNGSVDQSLAIAENLTVASPKFYIINLQDGGKGRALKTALSASQAETAVFMDVDLAVSLEALPPLINLITQENFDIAIGSRLLKESKTERSLLRESSSRIYNGLASLILKQKISDWQCGFKAVNQNVIKNIIPQIKDDGWFFDTELLALAGRHNYRLAEIPVSWSENRYAVRRSKVRPIRDGLVFLKNLLGLKKRLKNTD